MNKNIVLIDADSICYLGSKEDTLPQILEKVDYKINAILEETKADYYALFVSKGQYFRHKLKDESEDKGSYKANRTYNSQPFNKVIKEYLIAKYDANVYSNVEADDIIAWIMNKPFKGGKMWINVDQSMEYKACPPTHMPDELNIILAAVDKDLLQSIPGKHLNYNKKLGPDEWGMEWIETKEEDADEFIWKQMLMGDTSDGISGIPKIGPVKASTILEDEGEHYYNLVLNEYIKYYGQSQGIYEFQKNYRLLHLLDCDEDWKREVGYIPELPKFLEVEKVQINPEIFE